MRDYRFDGDKLTPDFDSGLGIMRARDLHVLRRGSELLDYTPEIMAFLKEPRPLIISKANIHARVHRRAYLDYIGVKRFDAAGNLIGEHRIVGLFTSTAYTRPAHSIPYLRRKIAAVEQRAGFDPKGHSGKALDNVLAQYPRDELFQVDEDTLYEFALAILQLDEHPRVRVLARRDRFDRFVSVLGLCAARALRQRHPHQDRRLPEPRFRRARLGLLPVLPGRAAGARALHHRPLGRRSRSDRPRQARGRCGGDRAVLDRRARRGAGRGQSAGQSARIARALSRCLFQQLP